MTAIHDLGYQRYAGARRSARTRWRVIVRNQLSVAWKTWWRYKAVLGLAVVVTFVAAGFLYLSADRTIFSFASRGGIGIKLKDAVVPIAMSWYCRAGFLLSLTLTAGIVAGDQQSGAFAFYFARSIRPIDYAIGKLAGMIVLMAPIALAGPIALASLRIGLSSEDTEPLRDAVPVMWKSLALGSLTTIVYAAVPLGFSALIPNRRYALAVWAAYYIVVGGMALGIGFSTSHWIGAIQLPSAIESVTLRMFDVSIIHGIDAQVPLAAGLTSIAVHVVGAIALVMWRVRQAREAGVGGAT